MHLAAFFKVADSYDRVFKKSRKRGGRTGVLRARHRVRGNEILSDALWYGFDYFLLDAVERDTVRRANNTLVARADELWVFGDIADGVRAEIMQAWQQYKTVRFFAFRDDKHIYEVTIDDLSYEDGVEPLIHIGE